MGKGGGFAPAIGGTGKVASCIENRAAGAAIGAGNGSGVGPLVVSGKEGGCGIWLGNLGQASISAIDHRSNPSAGVFTAGKMIFAVVTQLSDAIGGVGDFPQAQRTVVGVIDREGRKCRAVI